MSLVRFTNNGDLKPIRRWSMPDVYQTWLAGLKSSERRSIIESINARIDRMDVVRAQYVVCISSDEWHPEFNPVYFAMNQSREFAGKFIGLILWDVMNKRSDDWAFHKIDKTIVDENNLLEDIQVVEYFRAQNFPKPGRWRDELATRKRNLGKMR